MAQGDASMPTQADALAWAAERGYDITPQGRAFKALEELGEVAEAIIKIPEGRKTPDDLRMETAQLALCVMGLAESAGFDLAAAVSEEWVRANPSLLAERIRRDGV